MVSKLVSIINQLTSEKFISIADDPRPVSEKLLDFKYGEDLLLPMGPRGKKVTKLPFKAYDQGGTSACGAFSAAHARKLTEGGDTYALAWYRARTNFSGPGMFIKDVLKLMAKGKPFKVPAQNGRYTEAQANAMPIQEVYDPKRDSEYEYVQIEPYDVGAVVTAVSQGYAVLITFYSTINEWDKDLVEKDFVTLYTAPVRHYVIALPNSYYEVDGKPWISVIDSSPNKGHSLRQVSIEFLKKRMYLGGGFYYKTTKRKSKVTSLPTIRVEYGQRSESVRTLQSFLSQLGLLSKSHITGYYGNITAAAVLKWQLENLDIDKDNLIEWQGWFWGGASISRAKELYNV